MLKDWYDLMCRTAIVALPAMAAAAAVAPTRATGWGYTVACGIASATAHAQAARIRPRSLRCLPQASLGALIGVAVAALALSPPSHTLSQTVVTWGMLGITAAGMVNWMVVGLLRLSKGRDRSKWLISVGLVSVAILAASMADEGVSESIVGLVSTFGLYWGLATIVSAAIVARSRSSQGGRSALTVRSPPENR